MQGVHGDPRVLEACRQRSSEHHIGEFGLRIRPHHGVAPGQLKVVKVDVSRSLCFGREHHNARRRRFNDSLKQQIGQEKRPQVVGSPRLIPLLGFLAPAQDDCGGVDEHVDAGASLQDFSGAASNPVRGRQVKGQIGSPFTAHRSVDAVDHRPGLVRVVTGDEYMGSSRPELLGGNTADSISATRNHNGLIGHHGPPVPSLE